MKTMYLGNSDLKVPAIAVGCMRINSLSQKEAENFLHTCLEHGANFFDHADIYGRGECESHFSKAIGMNSHIREKIILQSKCGIVPGKMFDFSKEHILNSVDGILKRLGTDYLDVLLLHRPDTLMEPEEVTEAFQILRISGKVRHFGVSNQNPGQMELLQNYMEVPLVANQMQLSIAHCPMISSGINVNMYNESGLNRDGGILEYCRLNNVTIQAWSPFQYGFFKGTFIDSDLYPDLNRTLKTLGDKYGVSKTTIAIAWLLRHPAKIQPVTGTMNTERIKDCIRASQIVLTREEWYQIYQSAGNILP